MSEWINAKDEVPRVKGDVILYLGPNSVYRYALGNWETGHGFRDIHNRYLYTVTHWQPLPDPPN